MRLKKYFFVNNFPIWELIGTIALTIATVYLAKAVTTSATVFNFVPFLLVCLMCWGYVGYKIYIYARIYFSEEICLGEVMYITDDLVKIGYLDLYQNKVIGAVNVHARYRKLLATDMPVHFKLYGKWIEILDTNPYYKAYKKSQPFESYDLIGKLMMKVFKYFDAKTLI